MDLSTMQAHKYELHIVVPGTSKRVGLCLVLQPLSSPACQKVNDANRKAMQDARENGLELSEEELTDNGIRLYAASVTGWTWSGEANWNGETPDYSPDLAFDMLKTTDVILNQVMAAHGKQANFFANYVKD